MKRHRAFAPDKPFFIYWVPGAAHGPHHIFKEWADRYKGKFDDGWDAFRPRIFERQKQLGWIPADAKLTPRPETLRSARATIRSSSISGAIMAPAQRDKRGVSANSWRRTISRTRSNSSSRR
ncbi:hypothetical protein WOC76_21845 [Methylocystis sp. IM3]|jgi:arylsulfatase A-like enzyme|uniref:hypothetical protein n=1 Tax=unclassified Methylocystis TaxID=2625913 RepID=UPI0030F6D887